MTARRSPPRAWTPRERYGWRLALALTLVRLALAPVFVALGVVRHAGWLAAALLVAGFLSDVFDGVVARRFGVDTAGLRRLDSGVDTIFYLGVAFAAWRIAPDAVRANALGIALVVGTMLLNYTVEWARFRREASYHAITARIFGVALFAALVTLLATANDALLPIAIVAGLVSHAENFAITLVLPHWEHDVKSVWHAWRLRAPLPAAPPPTDGESPV